MADLQNGMTIKQVADQFGLPLETLRYYDNNKLFPHLKRNVSGYRIFRAVDIRDLRTILCFRLIGLGIDDIAGIMAPSDAKDERKATAKLQLLDEQRAKLQRQRDQLDMALMMLAVKRDIYSAADDAVPHATYLYKEITRFVLQRAVVGEKDAAQAALVVMFDQLGTQEASRDETSLMAYMRPENQSAVREVLKLVK